MHYRSEPVALVKSAISLIFAELQKLDRWVEESLSALLNLTDAFYALTIEKS